MILSLLGEALAAMAANRLRTLLTALGILIGVAAVVLMVAIGQGTQKQVEESIASMGSNLLIVRSGAPRQGGVRGGAGNMPTLTVMDAQAIRQLSRVSLVAPTTIGSVQLVYGPNNWNTMANGTNAEYLRIRDWRVIAGRDFPNRRRQAVRVWRSSGRRWRASFSAMKTRSANRYGFNARRFG